MQISLAVMMVVFAILFVILQSISYTRAVNNSNRIPFTRTDKALQICEMLIVACLIIIVAVYMMTYWYYIPSDSPGCLPYISDFGVIVSNVNPSHYAVTPVATYPATTYSDAIIAYRASPNGLATGYFSWDGIAVTILNSNAYELKSGSPQGTSWVFQDLHTLVAR